MQSGDYFEYRRFASAAHKARSHLAERFPPDDYGVGMPGICPRDLDAKDSRRLSKPNMLSQRVYMGRQMEKIFKDLAN